MKASLDSNILDKQEITAYTQIAPHWRLVCMFGTLLTNPSYFLALSTEISSNFQRFHHRQFHGFLQQLIVCKSGRGLWDGLWKANQWLQEARPRVAPRREAGITRQLKVKQVVHVFVFLEGVVERAGPQAGKTVKKLQVWLRGKAQVHVVARRAINCGRGRAWHATAMEQGISLVGILVQEFWNGCGSIVRMIAYRVQQSSVDIVIFISEVHHAKATESLSGWLLFLPFFTALFLMVPTVFPINVQLALARLRVLSLSWYVWLCHVAAATVLTGCHQFWAQRVGRRQRRGGTFRVPLFILLPGLLQFQLHDGVDVMRLDPVGVELNATFCVATAVPGAATGEKGMVHLWGTKGRLVKKKQQKKPKKSSVVYGLGKDHAFAALTWHLMPARLQPHVSGSQKPWQSQPQFSLEILSSWSCLFSSLSIFFTPAALSSAYRRFGV